MPTWLHKKADVNTDKLYPSDRYAYKTNEKNPIYVPVNRIQTPFQTHEATSPAKVRENVRKMKADVPLEPIVIGYKNHVLHDGHHRLEAAKKLGHTHVPCVVGGRNERRVKAAEKRYRKVWKSMALVLDGKLLIKKETKKKVNFSGKSKGLSVPLKTKLSNGEAHWVTVKSGPLEGRHLLIDGARPADGKSSKGEILAGHGIPNHVIEEITGATHAHHLEHKQSEGPLKSFPEEFDHEIQGRRIINGIITASNGKRYEISKIKEVDASLKEKAEKAGIQDPVLGVPRLGREQAVLPREVAEKALEHVDTIKINREKNMEINVAGYDELQNAIEKYNKEKIKHDESIERGEVLKPSPTTDELQKLRQKYPRAVAYIKAERYSRASNDEKSNAGRVAMKEIRQGISIDDVMGKMESWH